MVALSAIDTFLVYIRLIIGRNTVKYTKMSRIFCLDYLHQLKIANEVAIIERMNRDPRRIEYLSGVPFLVG